MGVMSQYGNWTDGCLFSTVASTVSSRCCAAEKTTACGPGNVQGTVLGGRVWEHP